MTEMGKLIVFEGTDGSGKSTQFSLLTKRLEREGTDFRTIVFPQYSEPSSALIRMYLGGEFGKSPSDINAYAASTFFAVDRYASYHKVWGEYYSQINNYNMKQEQKYEEAFAQLQDIVRKMENDEYSIDEIAVQLKEAQRLIKFCKDKLTKTEEEISKVQAERE